MFSQFPIILKNVYSNNVRSQPFLTSDSHTAEFLCDQGMDKLRSYKAQLQMID